MLSIKNLVKSFMIVLCFITSIMLAEAVRADGLIVVPFPETHVFDDSASLFPLHIKNHRVKIRIQEQTAVTKVEQEFFNPTNRRLEGIYIFPVPKGAVIQKFAMVIDGKEQKAELLDAQKARQIYEDIVRKQRDPALLEYNGQSAFKIRIFPIEPYGTKRISLSYQELVPKDNGVYEYNYPLNTEKFSAAELEEVSITAEIQTEGILKNVFSTSHPVELIRHGNQQAVVSYEAYHLKPNSDFKLNYATSTSNISCTLTTNKQTTEDGYFLLNLNPGNDLQNQKTAPKDITFVLDSSGSMAGAKLEQAQKALTFCVKRLHSNDRFQIIRFSTEAEKLFSELIPADAANIQKAEQFIQNIQAAGGTNIEEALSFALSTAKDISRPHFVVFITDGKPTLGETNDDLLCDILKSRNQKNYRIFTFGIGSEINTHLLDRITEMTRAFRTYISPQENLEQVITNFFMKVEAPILTELQLRINGSVKVFQSYPQELPDLFRGGELLISGRYHGEGPVQVILNGILDGEMKQYEYDVFFPKENLKNETIPQLWAARRIGYLLDQIRLHGEDAELVNEVADLARKYGIMTPYTSYLILEDEQRRLARQELDIQYQTLPNILPGKSDLFGNIKQEYLGMSNKTGDESVQSSRELQNMNLVNNTSQTMQGSTRLQYKDPQGKVQNLTAQVRFVQGRAFYNTSEGWIDSKLQEQPGNKINRIQFAGKEYFLLLRNHPILADMLALGRQVKFIYQSNVYEIVLGKD